MRDVLMTNGCRVVRTICVASLVTGLMSASVRAQQPPSDSPDAEHLQRIRVALTQPLVTTGAPSLFDGTAPVERHLGFLTFLPPDTRGEFIRVGVPIGAIVSRTTHALAAAQRHRAEKAAHDDVARVVAALEKSQIK
jgi:hypothetical protein